MKVSLLKWSALFVSVLALPYCINRVRSRLNSVFQSLMISLLTVYPIFQTILEHVVSFMNMPNLCCTRKSCLICTNIWRKGISNSVCKIWFFTSPKANLKQCQCKELWLSWINKDCLGCRTTSIRGCSLVLNVYFLFLFCCEWKQIMR